jgi:hypothetical protein
MNCKFVNKLRAILLSAICLLFSFQMNITFIDADITPQIKKLNFEQIVEYEDHLYQRYTTNKMTTLSAKKRHDFEKSHFQEQ